MGRIPREPRKFPLMSRLIDKPAPLPTEVCSDWSGTEAFAPSQARVRGVRAIPGGQGPRRPHHPWHQHSCGSNVVSRTRDARRQLGHQIGHRKHCAFQTFWHWSGRRKHCATYPVPRELITQPRLSYSTIGLWHRKEQKSPRGRERHGAKLQSPGPRDLLLQRERRSSRGGETAEWRFALNHELEEA